MNKYNRSNKNCSSMHILKCTIESGECETCHINCYCDMGTLNGAHYGNAQYVALSKCALALVCMTMVSLIRDNKPGGVLCTIRCCVISIV